MNEWYIWDYDDFMNGDDSDVDLLVIQGWQENNKIRGIDNPKYFIAQDSVSNDNLTIAITWITENFGDKRIYGDINGLTSFILETDEELMAFKLAIM